MIGPLHPPAFKGGALSHPELFSRPSVTTAVPILSAFLSGDYKDDVNLDNPLGLGGKLAQSFGALLHKLWQVLKQA